LWTGRTTTLYNGNGGPYLPIIRLKTISPILVVMNTHTMSFTNY